MALPATPSPCPNLRPGLALGAPEHQGFAATWNWVVGIFRNAAKYIVSSINGAAGDMSIVGGTGIQVVTSGSTITINVGDGDDENPGGGGGSGSGGGSGGGGDTCGAFRRAQEREDDGALRKYASAPWRCMRRAYPAANRHRLRRPHGGPPLWRTGVPLRGRHGRAPFELPQQKANDALDKPRGRQAGQCNESLSTAVDKIILAPLF